MVDRVDASQRGFLPLETLLTHQPDGKRHQKDSETNGTITRNVRTPYGVVPFYLLECQSLSPTARLVAVWIESKPEGWIVRPSMLQKDLGITEKQWLSARRAMMAVGIFSHRKYRKANGRWSWVSEFDATPILDSIPPLTAHGEAEDIEVREKELRNRSKQRAEVHRTVVHCTPDVFRKATLMSIKPDIEPLKKLHIGFVLDDLEIDWYKDGNYIYWDTHNRARKSEDGHWLWLEVNGRGENDNSGSAIDLIKSITGCTQAQAINHLRRIYREAEKEHEDTGQYITGEVVGV
jgi:hypothetical protein